MTAMTATDKTQAAAHAIQNARMAKIAAMLDVLKDELDWPDPGAIARMSDDDWRLLVVAARTREALYIEDEHERRRALERACKAKAPSPVTREQLGRIYRADFARHTIGQPDDIWEL